MKQFFMTIPDSLVEAAKIDGTSHIKFSQVILPLSKPVIATQIILSFRWFWNDFCTADLSYQPEHLKTCQMGLADFASEYYLLRSQMAALLAIIPVMIVLLGQKYLGRCYIRD